MDHAPTAGRNKRIQALEDLVPGDVLTVFGANPVPSYSLDSLDNASGEIMHMLRNRVFERGIVWRV